MSKNSFRKCRWTFLKASLTIRESRRRGLTPLIKICKTNLIKSIRASRVSIKFLMNLIRGSRIRKRRSESTTIIHDIKKRRQSKWNLINQSFN